MAHIEQQVPQHMSDAMDRIREIEHRFAPPSQSETFNPLTGAPAFDAVLSSVQAPTVGHAKGFLKKGLDALIQRHAEAHGVDASLIKAVIHAESGFNPKAVSKAGAQGLMQLMPGTARGLGVRNALNPDENVHGGAKYLSGLLRKYKSVPLALAAYNAGPGAVDKYKGVPPYRETQHYVKRVLELQQRYQTQGV